MKEKQNGKSKKSQNVRLKRKKKKNSGVFFEEVESYQQMLTAHSK